MVTVGAPPPVPLTVRGHGTLAVGQTTRLTAIVRLPDGSERNVSADSQWTSGDSSVARVSPTGEVTAIALGTSATAARPRSQTLIEFKHRLSPHLAA